jgi:beta-glucanase (GH16 family)
MMKAIKFFLFLCFPLFLPAQSLYDGFEGNGNIGSWYGDDCGIDTQHSNPHAQGINPSATVLEYTDRGGLYANVGFDSPAPFELDDSSLFSLKIYLPSNSLTGNQPNQVSLKLQNNTLNEPWVTQSEIIKPLLLDQWQVVTFDFANDPYRNLDPNSPPPVNRNDFNRVVIQLNGENNNDQLVAYLDDFRFEGSSDPGSSYSQLVWSDEFDGPGRTALDSTKWHHQTLLPNGSSWFNGEIQHYTDRLENSYVENGNLHIVARKETFTDQGETKQYTSARLNSKFAFTYGRVEVRAKLPSGVGTWPAIWMLGKNIDERGGYWQPTHGSIGWPFCGEIDIMEHWGHNPNYVQSALHTPSSFGGTVNHGGIMATDVFSTYHVYAVEWTPEKMDFSLDGNVYYTYEPEPKDSDNWPFDADQYLLLNIAIEPSIDPAFTQSEMVVDYVRVYGEANATSLRDEPQPTGIRLFPNPVKDVLQITLGESQQEAQLSIYSPLGRRLAVHTLSGPQHRLDWSAYPPGIYSCVISTSRGQWTYSLVKGQ